MASVRQRYVKNEKVDTTEMKHGTTIKICTSSLRAADLLRIIPFISAICLYFYHCRPHVSRPQPCLSTTVTKCLPIISLAVFVDTTSGRRLDYQFKKFVLIGLVCCCIGDAFLVYKEYFIPGMLAFAIGHICYIKAMGFHTIKVANDVGTVVPIATAIVVYCILFPNMSNLMRVLALAYLAMLCYMVLRATVRMKRLKSVSSITSFLGAWIFGLSDLALGVTLWVTNFEGDSFLIITLYYIAQFLIAISVLGF